MERRIQTDDVRAAVREAYTQAKGLKGGKVDMRVADAQTKKFGVVVMLTSGEVIAQGDDSVRFPLGGISRIPVTVELLTQYTPEQIIERNPGRDKNAPRPATSPFSAHAIRAISALAPQGDADGKMDILIADLEKLLGDEPVLDMKLYENLTDKARVADLENRIAEAGYSLYDDAPDAIDIYLRMQSLTATLRQVAAMGATIAADGVNPVNGETVFDGTLAAPALAFFAHKGPHRSTRKWMMLTGLPARSSFAGAIVAIMPGFGAIAAYSPRVDENGVSVRAAEVIRLIAEKLQLNVYASARVTVE